MTSLASVPAPTHFGKDALMAHARACLRARLSLLAFCLVACSGPKQSSPQPTPKKQSESASTKVVTGKDAAPLRIAYSDWPGWVAWEIALQKGWFQAEGVRVDFKWFEYVPSMEAFSAGQVDAVTMTNG